MPPARGAPFPWCPKEEGNFLLLGCPCSEGCSCSFCFGIQELEAIKAKLREIEKEDERLKKLQLEAENHLFMSSEAGRSCHRVLLSLPRDTSGAQGDNWSQSIWLYLSGHLGLDT